MADEADGAGRPTLRIDARLDIPIDELTWRFSASGGPGGQHVNTSNTKAEVRFDVVGSPSLSDRQRARLRARIGPEVRAVASDERSQARNRAAALRRLAARIADALHEERPRTATKPSRSSNRRRLEQKRRRADLKRGRAGRFDPTD